jgi:hypothetical protein
MDWPRSGGEEHLCEVVRPFLRGRTPDIARPVLCRKLTAVASRVGCMPSLARPSNESAPFSLKRGPLLTPLAVFGRQHPGKTPVSGWESDSFPVRGGEAFHVFDH